MVPHPVLSATLSARFLRLRTAEARCAARQQPVYWLRVLLSVCSMVTLVLGAVTLQPHICAEVSHGGYNGDAGGDDWRRCYGGDDG